MSICWDSHSYWEGDYDGGGVGPSCRDGNVNLEGGGFAGPNNVWDLLSFCGEGQLLESEEVFDFWDIYRTLQQLELHGSVLESGY